MRSRILPLLAGLASVSADRANLCFTAHAKTELSCRQAPVDGHLAVYDDGESPQRAQLLHFKKGLLCEDKRCKKCFGKGSGAMVACGKAGKLGVTVSGANGDLPRPVAIGLAVALLAVPLLVWRAMRPPQRSDGPAATSTVSGMGMDTARRLLGFAASWWFPWVAGFGTALNMFTLVFTAATVLLFLAAVLARPSRWPSTAIINALGGVAGSAILLFLLREHGLVYLDAAYPTLLSNPAWIRATEMMSTYGVGGMLLISSLPIFLHPIIAFGILSNMSNLKVLSIILLGRTIKYLTMAWLAVHVPRALRFFGIKMALVETAMEATKESKAN